MRPIYVMLYSGGVDSVVSLKRIVNKEIIPFIFHFKTMKLNRKYEMLIRKSAKLISPNSPFYVFETKTENFDAFYSACDYGIYLTERKAGVVIFPHWYADYVIIGYTRHLCDFDGNEVPSGNQCRFVDFCKVYNHLPFIFPIGNLHQHEVNKEWEKLPLNIRECTVSSTRAYNYGEGMFIENSDYLAWEKWKKNRKK